MSLSPYLYRDSSHHLSRHDATRLFSLVWSGGVNLKCHMPALQCLLGRSLAAGDPIKHHTTALLVGIIDSSPIRAGGAGGRHIACSVAISRADQNVTAANCRLVVACDLLFIHYDMSVSVIGDSALM